MNLSARSVLFTGFSFWMLFAAVALYFVMPLRKNIKFGIDLVGGTYITLDVKVEKAVEHELQDRLHSISALLKDSQKAVVSQKVEDGKIILTFDSESALAEAQSMIKEDYPELKISNEGKSLFLAFSNAKINEIKNWALHTNIEVLNTRLKKIGVEEITVSAKGDRSIIVELPDVEDPAKAKEMIGTPAILEFKIVEKAASTTDEILEEYGGELPEGMMIIPDRDVQKGEKKYYLVSTYAEVTGRDLRDAFPAFGGRMGNQVVVNFRLTPEGGRKFLELTSKNIDQLLAAVLDGKAVSVATIQSEINTEGAITGRFSMEKAKELSMLLKSGAFVAPVEFAEERRIGPSLGYESIKNGLMSCLIGLSLLFIFSVFYYKVSGLFAFFALLYNLLLILVGMALIRATLTLPGIAGMVLKVGMAIDASILIYERIKEALAGGMGVRKSVQEGFSDALAVILDANITHLIVAIVLFKFGSGPIKGFAITMIVGIVSTLITGIFFLKSIFNFVLGIKDVQKLSI